MNTQEQDRQDTRLRSSLTAAYLSTEPSDAFRHRVREEAARRGEIALRRIQRQGRVRLSLTFAGVAMLTVLAAISWPTLVAAQTLYRMESVMNDARSAHSTLWNVDRDGTRMKFNEMWYQAGMWRMEKSDPQEVQIFSDGKLWAYDPTAQEVRVQSRPGPFAYNSSGFSLSAYMHDIARWGWHDKIRLDGETVVNGRSVRRVIIDRDVERVLLLVDAQTDLPFSFEVQRKTDLGTEVGMVGTIEYNTPLAPSLFVPDFPKTARVIDLDHGKRDWQQRLAAGVASRRVADRTIIVRDLQVNEQGDVFLLYTADKFPDDIKDWNVSISDEHGTRYLPHQDMFQPFTQFASADGPTRPGMWQGYMFGGVKLEGNWWTPAEPQTSSTSHHLILTFHVAPKNEHGGWTEMWKDGHSHPLPALSETLALTLETDRPGCVLTPDYMPYMGWQGGGGLRAENVTQEDREVRLLDAWNQIASQAYQAQRQGNDLPKAIALNQQAIRLETQIEQDFPGSHTPGTNTYSWFNLYQIMHGQGRTQEARDALIHSRDESLREHQTIRTPPDGDPHWTQIQVALKSEGME
jgi:outer membrane lipoprotein-sorting protein